MNEVKFSGRITRIYSGEGKNGSYAFFTVLNQDGVTNGGVLISDYISCRANGATAKILEGVTKESNTNVKIVGKLRTDVRKDKNKNFALDSNEKKIYDVYISVVSIEVESKPTELSSVQGTACASKMPF